MRIAYDGTVSLGNTSPESGMQLTVRRPNDLGNNVGNYQRLAAFQNSVSNFNQLYINSVRDANGTDWTTQGMRLSMKVDSTWMGYMQFNGSGNNAGISFGTGTTTSAPGSVTERMRITSAGGLIVGAAGVGDVNNIVNTHLIEGNSTTAGIAPTGFYNNSGTANVPVVSILQRDTSTDSSCRFIQFYSSVTNAAAQSMGGIVGNGANNAQFAIISDIREKENIKTIESSLDKINKLNPVEFDWKKTGEHTKAGFIAQEVEEIFPEYVVENLSNEGEEERKGLTGGMTSGIVAHLVKSIQELKAEIELLKSK
jgi:hypothetical protein